jgi:hypothetical protein
MNIALIGGIDRLERHYHEEALRAGVDLRVFNCSEINIGAKLKQADAVVIFTNKVSHRMKKQAVTAAKSNAIPVFMHHSCGVCTLRDCLNCLTIMHDSRNRTDRDKPAGCPANQQACKGVAV